MKFKKKLVATLCGLGLLFGFSGIVGISNADIKVEKFKKDGFNIQLGPSIYLDKGEEFYYVMIWNENNIKDDPSLHYDGDTDVCYYHHTKPTYLEDKNGDEWVRLDRKWKSKGRGLESSSRTGTSVSDISYYDVPGSPRSVPADTLLIMEVDFDENEEYASTTFTNKQDALEWANNMVEIFKSKNYN